MKNFFSMLLTGLSIISYAQQERQLPQQPSTQSTAACNDGCITGSASFYVGQTVTFTSTPTAQCTSCYDWDINNDPMSSDNSTVGTIKISGSDMGKTVSIQGVAVGPFSIQLTYFDETGCHTCCFTGTVTIAPANCCAPVLSGTYECRGGFNTGGVLNFDNNPTCPVDWSKIAKIEATLTNALFTTNSLNTITIMGPNPSMGISVKDTRYECYHGNSFSATVKFYYNNGCPMVTKNITISDFNTPPASESKLITVSPNPTNSILKFGGDELNRYRISIVNDRGVEIIKDAPINNEVNIENQQKGVYIYRIMDGNKLIQEGRVIKE